MCGIAGINWNDENLIKKMINTLNHRGPDDAGYYIDDHISLGHTRLAIIDLSDKGKQPHHNEDESSWITFNGMIYNYEEIKKKLEEREHIFYSNSVSEVVIHAYEEYGYNCLNQFDGQFAFCIYDSVKHELFLARDKFGIKPLYYYYKDNRFIFASEIKAILEYDLDRKINKEAFREYFTYRFTFAPNTILQNIFKVKPEIIHCFMPHANLLGRFATFGYKCKLISSLWVVLLEKKYLNFFDMLSQRMVDLYTVNSNALKKFAIEYGILRYKIKVVESGVELEKFQPKKDFISLRKELKLPDMHILTMVAHLRKQKDYP
ncbi:unnamed protein product, partial [marine sediment metagenome]